ncbi:MAG: PIN domain-containing protein [Chloroflexi bacterium]|nr:PIN domain-containing protein [Chloroflexota bacterium]
MNALLDTSVVVRYFMQDQPHLGAASTRVVESEDHLLVSEVAIAEVAHVLMSTYRVPRELVVDQLVAFLRRDNVGTLNIPKDLVLGALAKCRPSGRVSIPDALIWAAARGERVPVYTFDRRFPTEGVTVLSPQ